MTSYPQALGAWHDFYLTAAAAAATLAGLLFVGLSLHIRVVVSHPDVRSLARATLTGFFSVLVLALLLLAPVGDYRTAGTWLLVVAGVSFWLLARAGLPGFRAARARRIGLGLLAGRFGLSALCYLAVAAMGVLLLTGDFADGLSGLLAAVVLLLVVAVRNTWDLLVTVADKRSG